jgi:hypothetical protein
MRAVSRSALTQTFSRERSDARIVEPQFTERSWQGAYSYAVIYPLKADAPDDAVEVLAQNMLVPLLEKLLADGTIVEYEIDQQAIHSDAPGTFVIDYITLTAAGLDKVNAAIRAAGKTSPLSGQALGSMVDFSKHRGELTRTTATYK